LDCSPGPGHFDVALFFVGVSLLCRFGDGVQAMGLGEPPSIIVNSKILHLSRSAEMWWVLHVNPLP
jgi:hypothetical protein